MEALLFALLKMIPNPQPQVVLVEPGEEADLMPYYTNGDLKRMDEARRGVGARH